MMIAVLLVTVVLVAIALWSANRGEDLPVDESTVGGVNAFDSYYGKSRWDWGASPPCEVCERDGCIGTGNCRCQCHKPFSKTRKK